MIFKFNHKILILCYSFLFFPYILSTFFIPFLNIDTAYYSLIGKSYLVDFDINKTLFDHKPFGIIFYGLLIYLIDSYHAPIISLSSYLLICFGIQRIHSDKNVNIIIVFLLCLVFGVFFEGMSANTEIILSPILLWLSIYVIESFNKPSLLKITFSGFLMSIALSINLIVIPIILSIFLSLILLNKLSFSSLLHIFKICLISLISLFFFSYLILGNIDNALLYLHQKINFLSSYATSITLFNSFENFIKKTVIFIPILLSSILLMPLNNIKVLIFLFWFVGSSISIIFAKNSFDHYFFLLAVPLIGLSVNLIKLKFLNVNFFLIAASSVLIYSPIKSLPIAINNYNNSIYLNNEYDGLIKIIEELDIHNSTFAFIQIKPDFLFLSQLNANNLNYNFYNNSDDSDHVSLLYKENEKIINYYENLIFTNPQYLFINKDFCMNDKMISVCNKLKKYKNIYQEHSISLLQLNK